MMWWTSSSSPPPLLSPSLSALFLTPRLSSGSTTSMAHAQPQVQITPAHLYYDTSYYESFDAIRHLTQSRQQAFSIKYWDPVKGSVDYDFLWNVYEDTIIERSVSFCQSLTTGMEGDSTAWFRCMQPVVGMLRYAMIHIISNVSVYYESYPFEEEIFALTYAYESPITIKTKTALKVLEEPHTACILGSPTAHSIITMLMYSHIRSIRVFSTRFDSIGDVEDEGFAEFIQKQSDSAISDNVYWNYYYAKEIADFFEKDVEYIGYKSLLIEYLRHQDSQDQQPGSVTEAQYFHGCHFIQIQPDFDPSCYHRIEGEDGRKEDVDVDLVAFLTYLSYSDDVQNTCAIDVQGEPCPEVASSSSSLPIARIVAIILSDFPSPPVLQNASIFEWQLNNHWFQNSYFATMNDTNGFVASVLGFLQQVASIENYQLVFTNTKIGTIRAPSPPNNVLSNSEDGMKTFKAQNVIIVTGNLRIYADNLFAIQHYLHSLGFQHVFILPEVTIKTYEEMKFLATALGGEVIQIALSFDNNMYSETNIIFNSENVWCDILFQFGWDRFQTMLNETLMIWTYSQASQKLMLEDRNMSYKEIAVVPYAYAHNRYQVLQDINILAANSPYPINIDPKDYFVVFYYGINSPRRETIIEQLVANFTYCISPEPPGKKPYMVNFSGIYIFDYVRDYYITMADVVLNLNTLSTSSLEVHRINYFLSLRKIVISERGTDRAVADKYKNVIFFVDSVEEMLETIHILASDLNIMKEAKERVEEFLPKLETMYQQEMNDAITLAKKALDEKKRRMTL